MAVVREETEGERELNIVVPAKAMTEVGRILSDAEAEKKTEASDALEARSKEGDEETAAEKNEEETVSASPSERDDFKIGIDDRRIVFQLKNTILASKLLDGSFLKYEDILPKEHATRVIIDKGDIQESVERASILIREGKNNFIKMAITNERMIISSRTEEGAVQEELHIEKEGEDLEIGFNSKFILDVLRVIPDGDLRMEFGSPTSPCIIKPPSGNAFEYLILPVRLAVGT
jgi:DNA polymerase-3 subunit beta